MSVADLNFSSSQLAAMAFEDLGVNTREVIDTQLLSAMDDAMKASIALLTSNAIDNSIFAAAPTERTSKSVKTITNRVELDTYRQEVEARCRDFIENAKQIESQLRRVAIICEDQPLQRLRDEVASLRQDLAKKDQLLAKHLAKLFEWRERLRELQESQSIFLEDTPVAGEQPPHSTTYGQNNEHAQIFGTDQSSSALDHMMEDTEAVKDVSADSTFLSEDTDIPMVKEENPI